MKAGVDPSTTIPNNASRKTPLHICCESGQEEAAKLLLSYMKSKDNIYSCLCEVVPGVQQTAFDLLRANDLNGMAKRLESYVDTLFHWFSLNLYQYLL